MTLVNEVVRALDGASKIVLTTHERADGDAIGCEAALGSFLLDQGKSVVVINPTPVPSGMRFLLRDDLPVLRPASSEAKDACATADLAVVLDISDWPRLGRAGPLIRELPRVLIDHHPRGGPRMAEIELRDESACATATILLRLLREAGAEIGKDVASALYYAVMTDTGGFQHRNTDAPCFKAAGELTSLGADPRRLYRKAYSGYSPLRYEALRRALETLTVHPSGRVAWMTIPAGRWSGDLDLGSLVSYPRKLKGVEVAILFYPLGSARTKVSIRSTGPAINGVAKALGGGGHLLAAGAMVEASARETRRRTVALVLELLGIDERRSPASGLSAAHK